ncbi:apolipoprotein N-acyltransferase [Desulfolutivibrio sulfoxidireducens]|uniref:apolipoprotein N-acyltransferase n=1 Tax=Desulfolutivibrio sulfoxidireducens TaxID=2773299 RepID=UPI00159E5D64|nr:apolipoprotein N-acyltransferase [Desulfolutivibrio sulfoxidireducens]QLA16711.1 apolipoprotein N-acyltransferase [Desulfolutivibrio sulfoxidireducens]
MLLPIALAVLGTWIGFANPVFQFPALILLFPAAVTQMALSAQTPGQAAKAGLWAGTLGALGVLYWTAIPIKFYGYLPWILALPMPVLLSLAMGLYVSLYAWLLHPAAHRLSPMAFGIYAGTLWTLTELARGTIFSGFPWLNLSAALAPWPFAIQGAAILGAYGLAGLLCTGMSWLVAGRFFSTTALAGVLVLAGLVVYGNFELRRPLPQAGTIRVGIVQGNVDQSLKWDPAYQKATVDTYLELSGQEISQAAPDLLAWPETALPMYFQDGEEPAAAVTRFARRTGVPVLTGSPAYTREGSDYSLFNRVYLVTPDGGDFPRYDKTHLVPFGEYVPFGKYLPFLSKLAHGAGDFMPGRDVAPLRYRDLALGVLICYEAIFPELAQARVEAGANLLVNVSNDAWFGRSSAPVQHLGLAALRAVEQGRFLIRATNTGISAVIDPKGRILAQSGLFTTQRLGYGETALLTGHTPFHRFRGLIHWTCAVIAAVLGTVAALSAPRRRTRKFR